MKRLRTANLNIKLPLAVVSMFAILATIFVVGAAPASAQNPNPSIPGVSSSDAQGLPPGVALYAALPIRFLDGMAQGEGNSPVFTIDFSPSSCDDALIGGTIHSGYTGTTLSSRIAIGALNSDTVVINSHFNEGAYQGDTNASAENLTPCQRILTITSNLNCKVEVHISNPRRVVAPNENPINFPAAPVVSVEKDETAEPAATRSVRIAIDGYSVALTQSILRGRSLDPDTHSFFASDTTSPFLQTVNPVPARGFLAAVGVNEDGTRIPTEFTNLLAHNDFPNEPRVFRIRATRCDAPRADAYRVVNAEPSGSVNLATSLNTQGGCLPPPNTSLGLINLPAGNPTTLTTLTLHPDCSYRQGILQGPGTVADTLKNGLKVRCDIGGILYFVDEEQSSVLGAASVATDSEGILRIINNEVVFTQHTGIPAGPAISDVLVQLTLFVTTRCPQVGVTRLTYTVADSVNSVIARTPLTVRIEATTASPTGCLVSPAVVTINGASATTAISEDPTAKSSTRIATASASVAVSVVTRNKASQRCSYKFIYPRFAGALSIETEGAGFPPPVAGITRPPATLGPAEDTVLDGMLEFSARDLTRAGFLVTVGYNQRELPVRILTNFSEGLVFTIDDLLRYRISVIGPCARFIEVLSRALGSTGTLREVQAFAGSTVILDESLGDIDRDDSPVGSLLTSLQPIIIDARTDEVIPCTLEVEELDTPAGCTVIGGSIQAVTFATGLDAYEFTFDHNCPGAARSASSRGLTH